MHQYIEDTKVNHEAERYYSGASDGKEQDSTPPWITITSQAKTASLDNSLGEVWGIAGFTLCRLTSVAEPR